MRHTFVGITTLVVAIAAPVSSYADLAFNVAGVTDYRFRGISQTRLKPALQGGVDYDIQGFYVGAWASTIQWIKDAGGDASAELDLYGGHKGQIAQRLGYDVGVLRYQYPSNRLQPSANTTEIYGAATYGPVTLKYSHSVTNLFGFADSRNSGYLDLSAGFDAGAGITLTPHVGYQKVRGSTAASYTDFALTASKDFIGSTVSLALVATDTKQPAGVPAYVSPSGKDLGRTIAVLTLKTRF